MSAGRIYWGQIAAVLSLLALGMIIATQWTATNLGFQPALGDPDWVFLNFRFYAPWRFFIWWFHYDHYARSIFEAGSRIILGFTAAAIFSAFGFSRFRAVEEKRTNTYGGARWASSEQIAQYKLFDGAGVVLGRFGKKILRHDGAEHVLVAAPTNSGKSVGISLPTALVWPHSFVTFDLKGEAWSITSGLRAQLGPVRRFAPASRQTHRYNPVTNIPRGDGEVAGAQNLALILVDCDPITSNGDPHWKSRAVEFLSMAILWVAYTEKEKTLAQVVHVLSDPRRPFLALLQTMMVRPIKDGAPHPFVAENAQAFLRLNEPELASVVSSAMRHLAAFRDPVVANATSGSDFTFEDLVRGEQPLSLYVIIPPEELTRLQPVYRMLFAQGLHRLTKTAGELNGEDGKPLGRRVLLLLDEFTQLGRMDFFEKSLSFIRGYRIKVCMVAQSLNQIAGVYGPDHSILDNAHVRVVYACNDERTAKRISDMLGATTETRSQMNYAGSRMAPWLGHTMVSRQEVPRPLLTPGEVMQLPPDDEIIFMGGSAPIRAKKIRYFKEPLFKDRLRPKVNIDPPTGPGLPHDWDSIPPVASAASASAPAPISAKPSPSSYHGAPHAHRGAEPGLRQQVFDFSPDAQNNAAQSDAQNAAPNLATPDANKLLDQSQALTQPNIPIASSSISPDQPQESGAGRGTVGPATPEAGISNAIRPRAAIAEDGLGAALDPRTENLRRHVAERQQNRKRS